MPPTLISGGQTGVDRAALDLALEWGLPCGGFCPRGRLAEDGPLDERYPLIETPSADYAMRTEWNLLHSDATLVLHRGRLRRGTALTVRLARRHGKSVRLVDLAKQADPRAVAEWMPGFQVLNVAGPPGKLSVRGFPAQLIPVDAPTAEDVIEVVGVRPVHPDRYINSALQGGTRVRRLMFADFTSRPTTRRAITGRHGTNSPPFVNIDGDCWPAREDVDSLTGSGPCQKARHLGFSPTVFSTLD